MQSSVLTTLSESSHTIKTLAESSSASSQLFLSALLVVILLLGAFISYRIFLQGHLSTLPKRFTCFFACLSIQAFIILSAAFNLVAPIQTISFPLNDFFTLTKHENTASEIKNGVYNFYGNYYEDETTEKTPANVSSQGFTAKSGAYKVTIVYESDYNTLGDTNSYGGSVRFFSDLNPSGVVSDFIYLHDGHNTATGAVWITNNAQMSDIHAQISYHGYGNLTVSSITIEESFSFRIVNLLKYIVVFLIMDYLLFIFFFKEEAHSRGFYHRTILWLAVLFASYPLYVNFLFYGHDLPFHMARIASIADALQNGQFPVRMLTTMVNDYSYPTSLFYCDLFLYLPAMLYNAMVPLRTCYQIYIFLINSATAFIAYHSFSCLSKDKTIGVITAILYTLAGYRLICVYTRAAVGEYTAMTFLPLVLVGIYLIYTEEEPTFKHWFHLTIGMSGLVLSHVITFQLVIITLVSFCLIFATKTFQLPRLRAIALATVTTIALCAWFLVPFLSSMTMDIRVNVPYVMKLQDTGLYIMQLFSFFMPATGYSAVFIQNEMPLAMGMALTLSFFGGFYFFIQEKKFHLTRHPSYHHLILMYCFAISALICSLRVFPWDSFENLFGATVATFFAKIQFLWRWLSMTTLFTTAIAVFSLKLLKEIHPKQFKNWSLLLIFCTFLTNGQYFSQFMYESKVTTYNLINPIDRMNPDGVGGGEYYLYGNEHAHTAFPRPFTETKDVIVKNYEKIGDIPHLTVENTALTPLSVDFPVFNYDHYQVTDLSTGVSYPITTGEKNRISVTLPAKYEGTLILEYTPPSSWRLAELVSVLTTVTLLFYFVPWAAILSKFKSPQGKHLVED